jgi:hypothetical protein
MNKKPLPKGLISTTMLAQYMGGEWDPDRVRRMFVRTGIGFQLRDKTGRLRGGWFTTRSRIRDLSLELFEELSEVEF